MEPMYYIGLDVHKRKISYCVKDSSGQIHTEGSISATRLDLDRWMKWGRWLLLRPICPSFMHM
jgi:predicted NBD/HSP70 family sugar kinase